MDGIAKDMSMLSDELATLRNGHQALVKAQCGSVQNADAPAWKRRRARKGSLAGVCARVEEIRAGIEGLLTAHAEMAAAQRETLETCDSARRAVETKRIGEAQRVFVARAEMLDRLYAQVRELREACPVQHCPCLGQSCSTPPSR